MRGRYSFKFSVVEDRRVDCGRLFINGVRFGVRRVGGDGGVGEEEEREGCGRRERGDREDRVDFRCRSMFIL